MPPDLARSVPLIGADVAWEEGYAGDGWTVAILDTGVARTHPFLAGKVVSEACYSTASTDPKSRSTSLCPDGADESIAPGSGRNCPARLAGCDHGTDVAGIAAGRGAKFSGVARDAQLISIQVFSRFTGAACRESGQPSPCILSQTRDQLAALERVFELRSALDVAAVNMSLGGGVFGDHCDGDVRKLAIDDLRAAGIATVAASGNDGFNGLIEAPACISSAIAVGSTTKRDRISDHAEIVDLLAPGSRIRSSVPGSRFAVKDGNSFAARHVAGAFAVLRSADPSATFDQIEAALAITGRQLRRAGIAKPRIQVDAAVAELLASAGRPFNDNFAAAISVTSASGSTTGSNVAATAQPSEPIHAGVGGGHSVWWRWQAPQSGSTTTSTFGSDFDTVLAVYTGRDISQLGEVASNDDSLTSVQSEVEFQAVGGTTYEIAVDGYRSATGNILLDYALTDAPLLPRKVAPADAAGQLRTSMVGHPRLD